MTPLQFSTLSRLIYGDGWRPTLAEALNVSLRNVQHWAAGTKDIPPGVAGDLTALAWIRYHQTGEATARIDEIAEILRVITGAE